MGDPKRWADLGYANLLGRYYETKRHNIPLEAERRQREERWAAEREAERRQREQEQQARYDTAIREAEKDILTGKEVVNREVNGKSLIMQLFREHGISVPLKTQGWIINALHDIRYSPESGQWHYHYYKNNRDSTKMFELLPKLSAAIQTKQQFEEQGAASPEVPAAADEDEQDMEL